MTTLASIVPDGPDPSHCYKWDCKGECGKDSRHPDPSLPERGVTWSWLDMSTPHPRY